MGIRTQALLRIKSPILSTVVKFKNGKVVWKESSELYQSRILAEVTLNLVKNCLMQKKWVTGVLLIYELKIQVSSNYGKRKFICGIQENLKPIALSYLKFLSMLTSFSCRLWVAAVWHQPRQAHILQRASKSSLPRNLSKSPDAPWP